MGLEHRRMTDRELRELALSESIRNANLGEHSNITVDRAEAFYQFLKKKEEN